MFGFTGSAMKLKKDSASLVALKALLAGILCVMTILSAVSCGKDLSAFPEDNLKHYGIAGQKWGTRRWQNADGTFNEAGKERYFGTSNSSSSLKKEFTKVLNGLTNEVPKLENRRTDISNVMSRADLSENEAKKCIDIARKKLNEIKSVEPKVTKVSQRFSLDRCLL